MKVRNSQPEMSGSEGRRSRGPGWSRRPTKNWSAAALYDAAAAKEIKTANKNMSFG